MSELLTAILLLGGPVDAFEPRPPADQWPSLSAELQRVAIEQELLDPCEKSWVFTNADRFNEDLRTVRERRDENLPHLTDTWRFPSSEHCRQQLRANRSTWSTLHDRRFLELDRAEVLGEAICELDQLYHLWDSLEDAQRTQLTVIRRRRALAAVKRILGDDRYHLLDLPPSVPAGW